MEKEALSNELSPEFTAFVEGFRSMLDPKADDDDLFFLPRASCLVAANNEESGKRYAESERRLQET